MCGLHTTHRLEKKGRIVPDASCIVIREGCTSQSIRDDDLVPTGGSALRSYFDSRWNSVERCERTLHSVSVG